MIRLILRGVWVAVSDLGVVAVVFALLTGQQPADPLLPHTDYTTLIVTAANRYHLDPALLMAVVANESAFDPDALSPAGAMGLGQLMPKTAAWCGLADAWQPAGNVDCAARYLAMLMNRYEGDIRLALAAYNAGPGRVDACHCVPTISETQTYVRRVTATYEQYWQEAQQQVQIVQLPYPPHAAYSLVGNGYHGYNANGNDYGRDYAAPCGTPLYAPITGYVLLTGRDSFVGPYGAYNSFIRIVDDLTSPTVEVLLMHGDYIVTAGEAVEQGRTLIGYEANHGNSTGCHTHFTLRVDGKAVDPRPFLEK